jgi:glycosyltransferase involved in cell wall biosynthesis
VDVGSDDGSGDTADRYACRDSRIKIIHLSAQAGMLQGRKHAVDSAQSEYIMFLDGNAYLQEDACQKILAEEAATGADILGYGVTEVSDNNSERKEPQKETVQNILLRNRHESLLPIYLDDKGLTSGWNKCFQAALCKDAFHQMEGLSLYGMEEVYAFVIIYSMGKSFHACPFSVVIQYSGYSISERVSWNKKEFKLAATERTALEGIKRYLAREHVEAGDWLQKMQKQAVEGQIKRLNIITNPSYYLAGWQCLLEQWGSFVLSQYLYTIDNMPIPAYQHMAESNRNLQRISSTANQLMQENINCKRQIEDLVNNRSFKLGRLLTFIPRKIRGAIRCYRSQGLRGVVQLCKKRLQEKGV